MTIETKELVISEELKKR